MLFDVQIHCAMHAITNAAQNENALNVKKNLFEFLLQMIVTIMKKMKSETEWTIDPNFQNDSFRHIIWAIWYKFSKFFNYCLNTENRNQCRFFLAKSFWLKVVDVLMEHEVELKCFCSCRLIDDTRIFRLKSSMIKILEICGWR